LREHWGQYRANYRERTTANYAGIWVNSPGEAVYFIGTRDANELLLNGSKTDQDDPTVDPRFGKIGRQTIEDTNALTKKRMETIDDETSAAAIDYMKRQHTAGKPFFVWLNSTRMHLRTHVRATHRGRYQHGDSEYIDGMEEHDDRPESG
jgi:arylsulfatase A-like enzyme